MPTARLSRALAVAALAGLVTATAACGSGGGGGSERLPVATSTDSPAATAPTEGAAPAPAVPAGPFGPGCAALPPSGPGSLEAIASEPVGIAISQIAPLSTLTQTVVRANLPGVVNGRADITVLAPADAAFGAVDPAAVTALNADVPRLTSLLTHHVLAGRLSPEQLVGQHTTLNGDVITIDGSGTDLTLSPEQTLAGTTQATVLCGNILTANATLYVIDQVLAPVPG